MFHKIVITGAAGFVGSHVYDHFSEIFPDAFIVVLDKMTYAADIRNIPGVMSNLRHSLVVGDICNLDVCLRVTENSDLVIHLAAESHVDKSFGNSMVFTESNTLGTHTVMEACKINKVKKIIHVSTDEVYGENVSGPFFENHELNPTNPYAAAKAGAEMIVKSYFKSFDLPVVTVRANNIYGIRQFPEKIIPRFSLRALSGMPLEVHGDGSNLRHYLAASDFAKALELVAANGISGEAYNVASQVELNNLEMANLINSTVRPGNNDVTFTLGRPFNDARYQVNDDKIRALGWGPTRSIIEDLPEIIDWYRLNATRYAHVVL
jgi:dTDP-glucose 4,6-dehydratase